MNVRELIDILKDYAEETEVELAVVAPVAADEDIAVDRYLIEGVMPWDDEEEGESLWLVGGEEGDVEAFLDAVEGEEDEAE